jgi:nucleoside triphosphate diphosphatase
MATEPSRPPLEVPRTNGTLDQTLALVRLLRVHCPWDAEQTASSLVPHLLEETHEVVDAIHDGDPVALEGELGDLLLNLAFQIVVAEETGSLSAASVSDRLVDKMVRRHPHLFGGGERQEWEALKASERAASGKDGGVLSGLAKGVDPLTRAHRIQERVSSVGFDWADPSGAFAKVAEELEEVREALASGRQDDVEEELGDLLFAAVNLTRLAGAHPTTALAAANRKFQRRFERLETRPTLGRAEARRESVARAPSLICWVGASSVGRVSWRRSPLGRGPWLGRPTHRSQ